jgi:hypothetical protein
MKTPEEIEAAKWVLNGLVSGIMSSGEQADNFTENCEIRGMNFNEAIVKIAFAIAKEFVKQSKEE